MECTFTNCLSASTSVALLKVAGLCSSSKSKSASDCVLSAWDCFTLHIVNVVGHTSWAISATLAAALTLTHILALDTFSHKAFANVLIVYIMMPTPTKRNERSVHHSSQSSRHCKEGSPRRLRKRPHWLCDARSHQVCATQQTQEQNR